MVENFLLDWFCQLNTSIDKRMTKLQQSRFHIADMDCPSEEQLIRSALATDSTIEGLEFDLTNRTLRIWHTSEVEPLQKRLEGLRLGARLVATELANESDAAEAQPRDQAKVLRLLLAINATMFVVELVAGLIGESAGLLSDSLDMLADAAVYGIALWAVGGALASQQRAARISGWLEMALAVGVLAEVARHVIIGSTPQAPLMMGTAALALVANVTCVVALSGHRTGGVHMQASWIFSTNDVIANLGVILAGVLVYLTSSRLPDLIVGTLIGLLVMRGAFRILSVARSPADDQTPT